MFYVSGISGSLVPFDPEVTPISRRLAPVTAVQQISKTSEITKDSAARVNRINQYADLSKRKERKRVIHALDIMSSPVFSLNENSAIADAQKIFSEHKYRHIPVISNSGKLVGIISDRDFVGSVGSKSGKISDYMITNILTARPQTEIKAIAEVMIEHRIGCLPILDERATLVGILTRSDILRAIVNHAPIELWT